MGLTRTRLRVEGIVQGVGFRPFVHALASRLGLAGLVGNDAPRRVRRGRGRRRRRSSAFLAALRRRGAAAGRDRAGHRRARCRPTRRAAGSRIAASDGRRARAARWSRPTPPPAPTACASCATRPTAATGYPFINCTNCGPRFTIVTRRALRPAAHHDGRLRRCAPTARREYHDPADRRFHAQPICCPACGPRAALLDRRRRGRRRATRSPTARGAAARRARSSRSRGSAATTSRPTPPTSAAVAALRARKHREDKPFAVMVADLAAARRAVRGRRRPRRRC